MNVRLKLPQWLTAVTRIYIDRLGISIYRTEDGVIRRQLHKWPWKQLELTSTDSSTNYEILKNYDGTEISAKVVINKRTYRRFKGRLSFIGKFLPKYETVGVGITYDPPASNYGYFKGGVSYTSFSLLPTESIRDRIVSNYETHNLTLVSSDWVYQ